MALSKLKDSAQFFALRPINTATNKIALAAPLELSHFLGSRETIPIDLVARSDGPHVCCYAFVDHGMIGADLMN